MTKRQKIWYGFLVLLMITGNGVAVYAAIRDKNWLWAIAGSIALVGVIVSFGGIFIGAIIAERKGQ
jgi:uncharacterized membrane protein YfcA